MGEFIFFGIVAAVLIAVGAYYLARFLKGKLSIVLTRNAAATGELISGMVTLQAKKPINGLLKVSLVGREKRRKHSSSGKGNSTEWVEVYRYDQILEETRQFEMGYMQDYAFDLLAPSSTEVRVGGSIMRQIAGAMGEGAMSKAVKFAAEAADFMKGRVYWHVESRLDADGVDLYTKHKCQINLRG